MSAVVDCFRLFALPSDAWSLSAHPKRIAFDVTFPHGLGASLNERLHWGAKARKNKNVRAVAAARALAAAHQHGYPLHLERKAHMHLIISWGTRNRLHDLDNAFSMVKPITDGIRQSGLIHNDSPKWLTLVLDQVIGSKPFVSVRVEIERE